MNIIKELQEISNKLDEIDEYYNGLSDELSKVDCKIQDLLHYIEFNTIQVKWCYRMMKELKMLREKRRIIKNDMEILSKYTEIKNRLPSMESRKFMLAEIFKKEKQLNNQVYINRSYSEEEINNIVGKRGEKDEENSSD